jgi:putative hemolysin
MANQGDKKAIKLVRLTDQPSRFLATIQVGITMAGFLGSAFAADNFSGHLVYLAKSMGIGLPDNVLKTISVILITLLISFVTLLLGELVPKRIAMKKAESLAMGLAGFIYFVSIVAKPVVSFLTICTNLLLRLFGINPNDNHERVTEEEILMMIGAGTESGAIDQQEKAMIENIFAFDDMTAADVMVHRTDVNILWESDTLEEWERSFQNSNHSRMPVCGEDVDDIIGIMHLKDFYTAVRKGITDVSELCTLARPAYFVPETVKIDLLFRNMQSSKNHFAIVVDDHGGVSGIITISDILSQIVGDIGDGPDEDSLDIIPIGENKWRVRGITPIEDIKDIPFGDIDDDYETVGGLALGLLGELPEEGDEIPELEINGLKLQVAEIRGRRVEWVDITKVADKADK